MLKLNQLVFRSTSRRFRSRQTAVAAQTLENRTLLASFTPGNILVSNSPFSGGDPMLYEYSTSGTRLQAFPIPEISTFELARDLVVDLNGNVQIYNGTFTPELATFDTVAGTINQTRTFGNWSTGNNLTYGGIAAFNEFVFVTDTVTGSDTSAHRGIVRFNINDGTAVRFASAQSGMIDVAVGLDGLVYALGPAGSPNGTSIHVYDPNTLAFQRTIAMPNRNRAIAVNAAGHIFAVGDIAGIRHHGPNGIQIGDTLSDGGIGGLADIDVDQNGSLLIASHGGVGESDFP
ncbi:MAG: hypothetical protein ABGZ53_10115 [Fuerstiella sp.]